MRRRATWVATLMVVALAPGLGAQSTDDSVQQVAATYSAWTEALGEFTKGIEFDEEDVTTLVERYPEMQSLDLNEAEWSVTDPAQFDNNMRRVLAEPEYRTWASRNGFDPENWLRTVARISSVYMMREHREVPPGCRGAAPGVRGDGRGQCAQSDPETCRSMREALAAGDAMSEALAKALGKLPPPTAGERGLMDRYALEKRLCLLRMSLAIRGLLNC